MRIALLVLALLPGASVLAQSAQPGHLRVIQAARTDAPPTIDGSIDALEWEPAAVAADFWLAAEQRAPTRQTEVLVLADDEYLYFAFRCFDTDPDRIEGTRLRRDRGLGFDDQVVVEIDPYHNHREISRFSVNALGTQHYSIAGGSPSKIEWKGDWKAAARVTPTGWTAEMAIPFEILKYRPEQGEFGVNFLRYHHAAREWSAWADTTPQARRERMGHLRLDLPDADGKHNPLTLMPFVFAARNTVDKEGAFQRELVTAGADIRYEPGRNSTVLVSANPDFSSLEAQITDIDFSDNEKRTDDIRPFFEEGRAFFTPESDDELYFYSNRVPDFDLGAKYFSRQRASQFGVLVTEDPFSRKDVAARYRFEFDATHELSSMLVATDRADLDNELFMLRFAGNRESGINYVLESGVTATDDDAIGDGGSYLAALGWRGDHWWVDGRLDRFESGFFPANGLQKEDTIGTGAATLSSGYYRSFAARGISEVDFSLSYEARDTLGGDTQRRMIFVGGSIETARQVRLGLFYSLGDYRPVAGGGRGEYAARLRKDDYWTYSMDFNTRSNWLGYGFSVSDGFLGGGDYRYVTGYAWIKPTRSTVLNFSAEQIDNFSETEQTVISGGWDFSRDSSLLFRVVRVEEFKFNRLAYRKSVSDGMDVFLVYNDDAGAETNYSMKLLWTLD